jgi:hypothetical protein
MHASGNHRLSSLGLVLWLSSYQIPVEFLVQLLEPTTYDLHLTHGLDCTIQFLLECLGQNLSLTAQLLDIKAVCVEYLQCHFYLGPSDTERGPSEASTVMPFSGKDV